jgi:hypothetical protein
LNRKQRDANRENAKALRAMANLVICPECGEVVPFGHWASIPQPLAQFMLGMPADGFWRCERRYGADGRRIAA